MTNSEFKIKRRKGKWKRGMMVCCDCHRQPVRVGDAVWLRYDKLVGFGEWRETYIDCIVEGCPKGGVPLLSVIGSGNILTKVYEPEVDLEKIEPEA